MRRFLFLTYAIFALAVIAGAQAPTPSFTASLETGCSPLVVKFSDQSSGNPTTWFWDFGNGATSTLKDPSTTYFLPGTYTVTLKVTNANGSNTVTKTNYITVYDKPEAHFTASDSVGCFPLTVQLRDQSKASSGTINTSWTWDLGDGTESNIQNPQKTYLYSGNYTISLKVTNDKGCWSTATKLSYIKVTGGAKADFNFTKVVACDAPFPVKFTNTSSGSGTLSYTWDFGDGTTSTAPSPTHSYTKKGIYSVALIMQSSNGCRDTLRKDSLLDLRSSATSFTAPDTVCINKDAHFINTSPDDIVSTSWSFGDGTTSVDKSPVKSFAAPGLYAVTLLQSYSTCTDSTTKNIQVIKGPTAQFSADKRGGCQAPLRVSFQNTSTNAVSYYWNFGDSTTSNEASPTHMYTNLGEYTVTLIAINASGCTDTLTVPGFIKVAKPVIAFASLPAKGCLPYTHVFKAVIDSSNLPTSYLWRFGEGSTSTLPSPTFTYKEPGTYNVSLTITTAGGCTETFEMPAAIKVGNKPEVAFSPQPNEICASQELHFTTQIAESDMWTWDFGDGTTAGEPNPNHQFSDTGIFYVKLVVENSGCKDTFNFPHPIKVNPPIARFAYKANCDNKLVVAFENTSIGAQTYEWNFGDGKTSVSPNPVHTFPAYGTYKVRLRVTNDTCSHETTQTVHLVKGIAGFTVSKTVVCKGEDVTFTADYTDSASIKSYAWDLGDGSAIQFGNPLTTAYSKNGKFPVTLKVTDINGCESSITKPALVQINGPTAGFTITNNTGCRGSNATFTDASKTDGVSRIISWQWDLGEGTVIGNTTPDAVRHLYTDTGTFNVTLVLRDAAGCKDQKSTPLVVRTAGVLVDFVSADTISCPGAPISFTNLTNLPSAFSSSWSFGNGSRSTEQNPVTSFTADGLYTITLKVNDSNGCTDSITKTAYIAIKSPAASFTVSNTVSNCVPFRVQYTNTSTNFVEHVWDLNGGTSLIPDPTQYITEPGNYQTRLIVTSRGGCTDTATKNIRVFGPADSKITYLPLDGCKPLRVDLQAQSPQKMNYVWDFGDGIIVDSGTSVTQHVYNSFGDFVPKVILKDSTGCVVPVSGLDTIRIIGVTAKFGLDQSLLCDRGMVNLTDSTTFNDPVTAYNWNFGDGTTSTQPTPSHWYARPGNYNLSLNVTTESHCADTYKLPVQVVASPSIHIGGDTVVCAGENLLHLGVFDRPDTSVVRWSWLFPNGKTSALQLPLQQVYNKAGNFTVQAVATNSSGCKDTAFQNIIVNPLPSVTLPTVITTQQATPVLIPAVYSDNVKSYTWNNPESLNCTTCPQPTANPKHDTKYNVTFTDRNGCINTAEVQVIVLCSNDNIFLPNTFSPNGDGSNDLFYPRGKGLSRVKSLRIFNRWGEVVFERVNFNVNDPSYGWNGTFKGARPVPGVYVYQVEIFCDNSQIVKFEGNVALIQ